MFAKLSIKKKILFPLAGIAFIAGIACFFYFSSLIRDTMIADGIQQARTMVLSAEASREYTASQNRAGIFRDSLKSLDAILLRVPIFSAITTAKSKAKELHVGFKVPKFSPRNPDNEPDAYEAKVLHQLEKGTLEEFSEVDEATDQIRYFKPIKLTQECLSCHGDPAESNKYWGNSNGQDPTGHKMEGWKEGEIHGAFEILKDMKPIRSAVNEKAMIIAGVAGTACVLIIFLAIFLSNLIGKPIAALESAAKRMANGDTDVKVEIDSQDELGVLSNTFNHMVANIKLKNQELLDEKNSIQQKVEIAVKESEDQKKYLERNINKILIELGKFADGDLTVHLTSERDNDEISRLFAGFNASVVKTHEMVAHVRDAVITTADACSQISSSAEEVAVGANEQSNQTSEVATAVEQMSATIFDSTRNTNAAADASKKAGSIAVAGGVVIKDTVNGMQRIAEVVRSAAQTVQELGENSEEIGSIVQVIDEIAEQTNLLALNAAIEAARAGEQGRGFAVVADEVRKLAERTSKATKEIGSKIKNIQTDTADAVSSMNKGTSEVEQGMLHANQSGESLDQIISGVNTVVDLINHVATASEEQATTVEHISNNVEGIKNVAHESADGIRQIAQAAEGLDNMAKNLKDLLAHFILHEQETGLQHRRR